MKNLRIVLSLAVLVSLLVACQASKKPDTPEEREAAAAAEAQEQAKAQVSGEVRWTKRAYPTGRRETSDLLVERGMPRVVQAGQRYDYEIRLTNLTDMVLVNVVVSDTAPAEFQVPEGAAPAQVADNVVTWRVAALEAGASMTLRGSGLAGAAGSFRHIANVTYDAPLAGTTTIVQPKLELERKVPEVVVLIDGVVVEYVVRNAGTGVAREVVIEETLPEGYTLEDGSNAIRIEVGDLRAGQSETITRKVKAATPGNFEGAAKVSGFGGLGAETAKQSVKVAMPKLRGAIAAPKRAAIGQEYTVTVTVGNDGDGPARDTITSIVIPQGATYIGTDKEGGVTIDQGMLWWRLKEVPAGGEDKLAIRMRADTAAEVPFKGGTVAHGADRLELAASLEQYGIATVNIEVRDEVDPLEVGGKAVYLVSVRNQGTAAASNIRLVCTVEEGMLYVESTGSSGGSPEGDRIVFEAVEKLEAKATLEWRIVVEGQKAGDRRFQVAVSTDQLDRPVEASESTRFFEQAE